MSTTTIAVVEAGVDVPQGTAAVSGDSPVS